MRTVVLREAQRRLVSPDTSPDDRVLAELVLLADRSQRQRAHDHPRPASGHRGDNHED